MFKNKKTSIFYLMVMCSWIMYSLFKLHSNDEASSKLMGVVMGIVFTGTLFFIAILGKALHKENLLKKESGNSNFGN